MQVAWKARRLARVLRNPSPICLNLERVNSLSNETSHTISPLWRSYHSSLSSSGIIHGTTVQIEENFRKSSMIQSMMPRAVSYSSDAGVAESAASEAVKELHDKMQKSITEKRSAPPNAWLWSMIEKCANHEDIKLLFDILQKLRAFRLSNLRIHENFNCALCQEITKACVRVGAIDYAKKGLWKHNVYGLSPTIGSAHHLLLHAKQHNDAKLMADVMKLVKKNDLPLQPGTADIVFNICYDTDKWNLISKYGKRFVKAGVNLRRTAFDVWMKFAAKRGDVDSLWKIEKFRSESMKQHSLASGFSCAKGLFGLVENLLASKLHAYDVPPSTLYELMLKGFLLERKPENASAIIQVLNQSLSEAKRPGLMVELEKLVSEWPLEVVKNKKDENKEALAAALQEDIPAMIGHLSGMGIRTNVNMEDLTKMEGVLG